MARVVTMLQNDMEIPMLTRSYQVFERGAISQQSASHVSLPRSADHLLRSEELPFHSSGSIELIELQAK